jgi:hypothetical protein
MINAIDEMAILKEAAAALQEHDKRRQAVRESDEVLRALCRRWGEAAGLWGVSPTHLRRACETRGLLNEGTTNDRLC